MADHLTLEERRILERLMKHGIPRKEIAVLMDRDPSTISRELARNAGRDGYCALEAQHRAERRRRACRRPRTMSDPEVYQYVRERLEKRWSPDQIAGRRRYEVAGRGGRWLSGQTIYNWIHQRAPSWQRWLRRGGRRPEKRGRLTECVRIDGRPDVINHRRRYGDWEGDTIVGKGRRNALLTLVERKSGYVRIGRLDSLKAELTRKTAHRCLKGLPASLRRSVTFDNGKEFAEHQQLSTSLDLEIYFALPYRSWQRGTNENTNGLLRQFFPKGTDFSRISHHEVARVETLLNERPRKRLDYQTPDEIFVRHC